MNADQQLFLEIPNESHEKAYIAMMDRWEASGEKVAPQLLGRYSSKLKGNVPYSRWLEWCEDDRTTGQALSTKIPCTLYFLLNECAEILGSIVINHSNTHRGHLHAGIAPWNRGKGYGSVMLKLALEKCWAMGLKKVDIVPYKGNEGAIKTILKNGGVLQEEFCEGDTRSLRYSINLERISMIDNMLTIAKEKASALDVCIEGLPAPQVTVLYSCKGHFYIAENDITGEICKQLEDNEDTGVATMLTMWKDGQVDVASYQFREAIVALNENNSQTDVILQGKDGYITKKLFILRPA